MRIPLIALAWISLCSAQEAELGPEGKKYHEMLLRRPQPGVLYDRFYAAWMKQSTAQALRAFLEKRTATAADILLLAIFLEQQGDDAAALKAYQAAVRKDPAQASAWVRLAQAEAAKFQFVEALTALRHADEAKPDAKMQRDIGKLRGRWLARSGDTTKAMAAWQQLTTTFPEDDDLAEELVDVLLDEGQVKEAAIRMAALAEKTTDAYSRSQRRLRLAMIQVRAELREDALKTLDAELNGCAVGSWIEAEALAQIEALFRGGENISGLSKHLAALTQTHPQRLAIQQLQCRVLVDLGQEKEGTELYQRLLEKTPGERSIREGYLDLLESLGQRKAAIEQCQLLLAQSSGDSEMKIRLATLQHLHQDDTGAQKTLESYLGVETSTEADHLRVVRLYQNWNLSELAEAALRRTVQTYPSSIPAKEALAQFLYAKGEKQAGLAIWQELAKSGTEQEFLTIVQTLQVCGEIQPAHDLLRSRFAEFAESERFLGQAVNVAVAAQNMVQALPWSIARLHRITDLDLLEEPLKQLRSIATGDRRRDLVSKWKAQPSLSPVERLALAELQAAADEMDAAKATLAAMPSQHQLAAEKQLLSLLLRRNDKKQALAQAEKVFALPGGKTPALAQQIAELTQLTGLDPLPLIPGWKQLAPSAVQPWLLEAKVLRLAGRTNEAREVLLTASKKFPDDDGVTMDLVQLQQQLGDSASAERILLARYDAEQDSERKLSWILHAAKYAKLDNRLPDLVSCFKERQRDNRTDYNPWLALAKLHETAEDHTASEHALRQALLLRPEDLGIILQLARLDEDIGNWKEAMALLSRVEGRDKTGEIGQRIANLQIEHGDEEAGFTYLWSRAGGNKMKPEDAVTFAISMARRNRWDRMLEFVKPFLQSAPDNYQLSYLYGLALNQSSRSGEAMDHLLALWRRIQEEAAKSKSVTSVTTFFPPLHHELTAAGLLGSSYVSSRQRQAPVSVPTDLTKLREECLVNLVNLADRLQPEALRQFWDKAAAQDTPFIDILPHMFSQGGNRRLNFAPKNLPPQDMTEAQLLVTWESQRYGDQGKAVAKLVYERYKGTHFNYAAPAGCKAVAGGGEEAEGIAREILSQAEKQIAAGGAAIQIIELLGDRLYSRPSIISGRMQGSFVASKLPEDLQRRIILYSGKADRAGRMKTLRAGGFLTQTAQILNACLRGKLYDLFIETLNEELKLYADPAFRQQSLSTFLKFRQRFSVSSRADLLVPLNFPLTMETPPWLCDYFRSSESVILSSPQRLSMEPENFGPLLPMIDQVSSPLLRAVIALKAGHSQRATALMDKVIQVKDPSVDTMILAASWHAVFGDRLTAAETLAYAADKEIPPHLRDSFDAALVIAVESEIRRAKPEWIAAAKQAATRLQAKALSSKHTRELMGSMKVLGMNEEVARWSKLTGLSPNSLPPKPTVTQSASASKLSNLHAILAGTDEAAKVREAAKQLRDALSSYQGGQTDARFQARLIMIAVGKGELRTKVLAAFAPSPAATSSKLMEYADFLNLIDEDAAGLGILQKLAKRDPKDHEAKIRLCIQLAQQKPELIPSVLEGVPSAAFDKGPLGDAVMSFLSAKTTASKSQLQLAAGFADFLAALPSEPGAGPGLAWMANLPKLVAEADENASVLPFLYARRGDSKMSKYAHLKRDSELAKLQAMTHTKICDAMLKHLTLAEEGFRRKVGLLMAEGGKLEYIASLATQLVKETDKAKAANPRFISASPVVKIADEQRAVWSPSPVEFLLWYADQPGNTLSLDKDALLASLPEKERAVALQQQSLRTVSESDFAAAATAYLEKDGLLGDVYPSMRMLEVITCWATRRLCPTALDTLMLREIENPRYTVLDCLPHYVAVRATQTDLASSKAYLRTLVERAIGPEPANWPHSMETALASRYQHVKSDSRLPCHRLLLLSEDLLQASHPLAIELATMLHLDSDSRWLTQNGYSMERALSHPACSMPILNMLGLTGEAAEFQLPANTAALQQRILSNLRGTELAKHLLPILESQQPRTLGLDLLTAIAKDVAIDDAREAQLVAFLKQRHAELASMPAPSQRGVMLYLRGRSRVMEQIKVGLPELAKAFEKLQRGE
jgi:thioredoxin-like negative regulator of GroEL